MAVRDNNLVDLISTLNDQSGADLTLDTDTLNQILPIADTAKVSYTYSMTTSTTTPVWGAAVWGQFAWQ